MKARTLTLTLVFLGAMFVQALAQAPTDKPATANASAPAAAMAAPIVIDMAKQPADVQAAQALLNARLTSLQRFVELINQQVAAERKAVEEAEAARDAAILKAAGKESAEWTVATIPATQTTPAQLRIVARNEKR